MSRLLFAAIIFQFTCIPLLAQDTAISSYNFGPTGHKYDQNRADYKAVKIEVEKLLAKADKSRLTDLLPFSVEHKTGIMDKRTMEVITIPTGKIKEIISIANPNLWGVYQNDTASYLFVIYQKDGRMTIMELKEEADAPNKVETFKVLVKDLPDGQPGYTLNERGTVTAQSRKYRSVQPAFNKDRKIYAVVQLKDNNLYGIVDTKGEIFPGFEFRYRNLVHNKKTNYYQNNIWFYAEDTARNEYFLGIDGRKKTVPGLSGSPFGEYAPFGYHIHHNSKNSTWGLFDQSTMEWVIAPQSLLELLSVNHTTTQNRLYTPDVADRKDSDIYIYVKEKKLRYYIGLNGIKYIPAEYLKTKPSKSK